MKPTSRKTSSAAAGKEASEAGERSALKFIPNIAQLQKAVKELPDPELWPDARYLCPIEVDEESRVLEFKRKRINRGSRTTYRWIYEGKILVRKRDI